MKTNPPLAIWSLVLGILSVVACGPVTGIPAIICGHMARSTIKMDPDNLSGEGMALAGLIMGYFSIIAFILLAIVGILIAITVPSMIHMFQDLQKGAAQPACNIMLNTLSLISRC